MTLSVVSPIAPATPEREPRPATVTVAAAFQAVCVVLTLGVIALNWASYLQYDGWITEAAAATRAADSDVAMERSSNLVETIVVTAVSVLVAVWFAATLWPMLRRHNVARVLSVVGAFLLPGAAVGLMLLSCLFGAFFFFAFASGGFPDEPMGGDFATDAGSMPEFYDKLFEMQGSQFAWGDAMGLVVTLLMALCVVVGVLLVVPSTNRWFKPPRPMMPFYPPYGYGYPGYGYPPPPANTGWTP
jgi:hypothetical protein